MPPEFKPIGRGKDFAWDAVTPGRDRTGVLVIPETASGDWAAACGPGFFRLVSTAEGSRQTVCVNSLNLWYGLAVLGRSGAIQSKADILADLAASFQTGGELGLTDVIEAFCATITLYGPESSFAKYLGQKRLRAPIPQL